MTSTNYIGIADYVVIALTLLISTAIGFLFSGRKQSTILEYAMGGRNMAKIPVIFSITVTFQSAATMLINPVETYRYGTQNVIKSFGLGLGMILSSYVFVPVYFQCGVSTIYEYLEMRFGKLTRYTISAAFITQMVIYMGVVLYSAVLALSAVTNLSFEISTISIGLCCALYSSIGGLKAVMWTDVFQTFLMCSCVITIYVAGFVDLGGLTNTLRLSNEGQRLQLFNFSMDPTKRYTFWNSFFRGIWVGLGYYGTSQAEVQRMLCMSTVDRAKSVLRLSVIPVMLFQFLCDFIGLILYGTYMLFIMVLRLSVIPVMFFQFLCDFMGLILYGIYHSCDPVLNKQHTGLTKYDQMIPYYIVTRVGEIPGLTGLCIAGIFSGSLSTISSALNSLATVTVVDFVKPLFPTFINEKKSLLVAKILSAVYGIICILCALTFSKMESIKKVVATLMSLVEGPMIAIFAIAVLTRKASDKCILFGLLVALPTMAWIGFGSLIGGYSEPSLPLSTNHCASDILSSNMTYTAMQRNVSITLQNNTKDFSELLVLYKISFNWLPILGTLITLTATFFAVIVTGWKRNVIPSDSKCLSPVTRLWIRNSAFSKTNTNTIASTCQLQQLPCDSAFTETKYNVEKENIKSNI